MADEYPREDDLSYQSSSSTFSKLDDPSSENLSVTYSPTQRLNKQVSRVWEKPFPDEERFRKVKPTPAATPLLKSFSKINSNLTPEDTPLSTDVSTRQNSFFRDGSGHSSHEYLLTSRSVGLGKANFDVDSDPRWGRINPMRSHQSDQDVDGLKGSNVDYGVTALTDPRAGVARNGLEGREILSRSLSDSSSVDPHEITHGSGVDY